MTTMKTLPFPRPATITRRHALGCCAAAVSGLFTSLTSSPARAALWNDCKPPALPAGLQAWVDVSLQGIDASQMWDVHAHVLGNGDSGSGCTLHPSLVRGFNLLERGRHKAILNASCVPTDAPSVDRAYVSRLLALAEGFPAGARWLLFAFDNAHDDKGRTRADWSTFHAPNAYAASLAQQQAARFGWVASIHPYREDALRELDSAQQQGALAIKWLPSSMNIDLRDARLRPFYDKLAATRMPLIVHCGEEKAVPGAGREDLGNPLHLRVPLERGVRIIAAHCASLGHALDIDQRSARKTTAFELFARLMGEKAHGDRLLGDISAVFQANRDAEVWRQLLTRSDWHPRLLNGSDYPLPGMLPLHRSLKWIKAGLMDEATALRIDELRSYNPLLADVVTKRRVRLGQASLPPAVFETRRHFLAATATS